MQQILLNGKIYLDENDQSRMNYIIQNTESHINSHLQLKQTSLTDILDTIHNSKNAIKKLIRVVGKVYNNNNNNVISEAFHCFKGLYIKEEKKYVESYYVGNFALERKLYEWSEKELTLEILIEDYTDSIVEFINRNSIYTPHTDIMEDADNDTLKAM